MLYEGIMMSFLKNFRRGFATNSSSSHSFVYMKKPDNTVGAAPYYMDFGWNDFRLSSLKEKLFYVLVDRIGEGDWGSPPATTEDNMEAFGADFPEFDENDFKAAAASYIDHQSRGTVTIEQARDPYVTIFGGNDNDGESMERASSFNEIDWERTEPDYYEEEKLAGAITDEFRKGIENHVAPPF